MRTGIWTGDNGNGTSFITAFHGFAVFDPSSWRHPARSMRSGAREAAAGNGLAAGWTRGGFGALMGGLMISTTLATPLRPFVAVLFLLAASVCLAGETPGALANSTGSANLGPAELFGAALQRVRTGYVKKTDDRALIKNAILGMVAAAPAMRGHPATKKALQSLETGAPDLIAELNAIGDFIAAAIKVTNYSEDRLISAAIEGMLQGLDFAIEVLAQHAKWLRPAQWWKSASSLRSRTAQSK